MRPRPLIGGLAALLALFVLLQLLLAIGALQPHWFREPLSVAYVSLWTLAGLAGLSVILPRPRRWSPAFWGRIPWLAGGLLLGFVVPGMFSIGAYMLFSGTLILLAAALQRPGKRYALEALLMALVTTGVVAGVDILVNAWR